MSRLVSTLYSIKSVLTWELDSLQESLNANLRIERELVSLKESWAEGSEEGSQERASERAQVLKRIQRAYG